MSASSVPVPPPPATDLRFASASSLGRPLAMALDTVCAQVTERLDGAPDVAFLFVSTDYAADANDAAARVRRALGGAHVLGCTGAGVCETAGESDEIPGVSVLAGRLPGAGFRPFHVQQSLVVRDDAPAAIREAIGLDPASSPSFLVLSDPFSLDPDRFLRRLDEAWPGAPAAGGLASGGTRPGSHRLFLDDESPGLGLVGLAVTGRRFRTVVSQGCRPVGRRFVVTKMKDGRVLGLSGEPALDALERTVAALPEEDRELARTNLLVGRAAHEARDHFGRGDFLVRNLVGVVPSERSVVVGDRLRLGQTIQLQLRDRATAEEDMDLLLEAARTHGPAQAALLFTCAGRGRSLFGRSGADVHAIRRRFGEVPLAGFSCGGEVGPVGGRNFVHGFTASIALW